MQRQNEQVQVQVRVQDTCVISTAKNNTERDRDKERGREGGEEAGSPLDGQLSWQLPVPHTQKVCAKVRNPLPPATLLLSPSPPRSYTRLSATEAIIIALIVSCVCVLCFILSGPELHKGVSPEKCPPLELRVSTLPLFYALFLSLSLFYLIVPWGTLSSRIDIVCVCPCPHCEHLHCSTFEPRNFFLFMFEHILWSCLPDSKSHNF